MYGTANDAMSFQLLDRMVTASAMIAVAACRSFTANVAAAFQSPCRYTGFSDTTVKPPIRFATIGSLPSVAPLINFRARRKMIGRLTVACGRLIRVVGVAAIVRGNTFPG